MVKSRVEVLGADVSFRIFALTLRARHGAGFCRPFRQILLWILRRLLRRRFRWFFVGFLVGFFVGLFGLGLPPFPALPALPRLFSRLIESINLALSSPSVEA